MAVDFTPNSLPTLIGSFPVSDHGEATSLVLSHTPEIPLWVQLPVHKNEGMVAQFVGGMPGLSRDGASVFIDAAGDNFENELVGFYEEYLGVTENGKSIEDTRFAVLKEDAPGFFELMNRIPSLESPAIAVKGQITGPFTFGTSVVDQNGRAIFYDDRLRDAMVKLLGLKACWQVRQLSQFGCPVILFFDEPALAGFGSSAFVSISKDEIIACFTEVIEAVHKEGGLAGIHVCANTEWPLILDSPADIVSFDAYGYFDRFILYPDPIRKHMAKGGILASGIVPTLSPDDIEKETADSLFIKWREQADTLESLGIDKSVIKAQTLITPSCGTGSLNLDQAVRVLELTRELRLEKAQVDQTKEAYNRMYKDAVSLGRKIVEKEGFLDHLFASGRIDVEKLREITLEIGALQGELRAVHLRAHLEMRQILSPHQIQKYDELRGYQGAGGEHRHQGHHGGHH